MLLRPDKGDIILSPSRVIADYKIERNVSVSSTAATREIGKDNYCQMVSENEYQ